MSAMTERLRATMGIAPDDVQIEHEGKSYSRGQVAAVAAGIERLLAELSLPAEARVGVLLRNRPAHVAAIGAVLGSDRCLVTVNPILPAETLLAEIARAALPVMIAEEEDIARPGAMEAAMRAGTAVIALAPGLAGARLLIAPPREAKADDVRPGVAVEMLTSGTTGTPKRVPLTRAAFEASFAGIAPYERRGASAENATPRPASGIAIVSNPLTHIGGLYGVIGALMAGRAMVLLEKFSVDSWVETIRRHRPKVAGAVPAAVRMLLEAEIDPADLSSLSAVICGTAPIAPELIDAFHDKYGIPILCNYGATEFAGGVAGWSLPDFRAHWREKFGSVGRIHGNVDARIVDSDTGAPLAAGEEGLLELRGDQLGPRYRRGEGEWLRTTDRAMLDADGFLFIRGRADNAIIRGGFKVHPDDVIAALHQHPAVREAAVVGVEDARLGAVPAAAVIVKAGAAAPSEDELRQWLRERLIAYQVPAHIRFVDDFPRTPSLKPAAAGVRALFENAVAAH